MSDQFMLDTFRTWLDGHGIPYTEELGHFVIRCKGCKLHISYATIELGDMELIDAKAAVHMLFREQFKKNDGFSFVVR